MKSDNDDKFILIGTIGSAFGIKGWVNINSFSEPTAGILAYDPWYINTPSGWKVIKLIGKRERNKGIIAQFEGCHDRDAAARYTHQQIGVHRDQLPETNNDEFYWADLEGLTVQDAKGTTLGTVDHMMETGANDVMIVKGEKTCLIPFLINQTIIKVDLKARCIQVNWDADE